MFKIKNMKRNISIFVVILLFLPSIIFAHPGRTDSSGCHTCRTNCPSWGLSYGEYHCHRAKGITPQPVEPIRSNRVEEGIGHTTPAPDYKTPNLDAEPKTNDIDVLGKDSSQEFVEEVDKDKDSDGGAWVLLWVLLAGGVGYIIAKMRKR